MGRTITPPIVRIMRRIRISTVDGCWEWPGAKTLKGYGKVIVGDRVFCVHRLVYEHYVGPIPEGFRVSPTCRNHSCCNPRHLEAVTPQEMVLRGAAPRLAALRMTSKTHCPSGHPYSGENLYVRPDGSRECRVCVAAQQRRSRDRRRALKGQG